MIQRDHIIDLWETRQQFRLDPFHCVINHAGHALHAAGDAQDVLDASRAIGIAEAFEGITGQRRQRSGNIVRQRQFIQLRRLRQVDQGFVDPAATLNRLPRLTNDLAITNNILPRRKIDQSNFVALRHMFSQNQSVGKYRTCRQAAIIDDDRHIVRGVNLDV